MATWMMLAMAGMIFGFNTAFWACAGVQRFLREQLHRGQKRSQHSAASWYRRAAGQRNVVSLRHKMSRRDVAVLIAAHNEAAVLDHTLRAAALLVPRCNIHVVSDGSTDETASIAASFGVHVLELNPNRGKAGALDAAIRHFRLQRNFRVMLLLDADTRLASDYLDTGLPAFDDPEVVAVAGSVRSLLDPPPRTILGRILLAYRARLYVVVQLLVKYGQSARWANVVSIIPGFASMYRTDILDRIDITAPGLVIEDFNMTFEIHAKRLGRIAFHPHAAVAYTQDPDNFRDYRRQIHRWSLGYWQTVRRHGFHRGRFWLAVAAQCAELVSSSFTLLSMVPLMLFALYSQTLATRFGSPQIGGREISGTLTFQYAVIGFLVPDMVLTLLAAVALRRPKMVLLAAFFPLLRLVDAYVALSTLPAAYRVTSTGSWISPTRRKTVSSPSVRSFPAERIAG